MKQIKRLFRIQPSKRILLVTLQKSGTHLIKKILEEAGLEGVGVGHGCTLSDFSGLSKKQYLWSHYAPSDALQMVLEEGNKSLYVIFNFRDPRDVLVSWFHWMHPKNKKNMHSHQSYMKQVYNGFSDDELMDIFIKEDKFRIDEYNPLEHFRLSRVLYFYPGVLNVRFEDLVGSQGGGSDKRQIKVINDIFKYLNIYDKTPESVAERAFDKKSATFRKGVIGGYKDSLSSDQLKLFHHLNGDIIQQYGYTHDIFDAPANVTP